MTQAIAQQTILDKLQGLTPQQQQEVLDFIEFLQSKTAKLGFKHPDATPISAYEAAKKWAGCVDSELGDLSTNKKYLEGFSSE
ncbi:MAG: DUF2281 domain-containing protein [Microcystaceae cyanobacterium]